MEMSRLLLLCALVALAYAKGKVNKSERLMLVDTCSNYANIMKTNSLLNKRYLACNNSQGPPMCFLKSAKCDSFKDCPNNADEMGCKTKHEEYCNDGFDKLKRDGTRTQAYRCEPADDSDPDDVQCIEMSQKCDGKLDCPHDDDERGCDKAKGRE